MSATFETTREGEHPEVPPTDIDDDLPVPEGEQAVTLEVIDWEVFEAIAQCKGDRHNPRLIYSDGSLTLVSPGYHHENLGERLCCLVMAVCEELAIPCNAAGATLFKRKRFKKGVEGDRTYYVANERAFRGKRKINLRTDPPPDLAIEIDITHPAHKAVEIWRKLGTPEVWVLRIRAAGATLTILHRDAEGRYAEAAASRSFPFLSAQEIRDRICDETDEPDSFWLRRVRQWVRDELAPRLAGGQGGPPR